MSQLRTRMIDYKPELFEELMDSFEDSYLLGYTVCGAQDPMLIQIGDEFKDAHPSLSGYSYVRIIDKYLNAWNSATLMEFSNTPLTDAEYDQYDKLIKEEEEAYDHA